MKVFVGIDPGLDTGGMAILKEDMSLFAIMTPRYPSEKVRNKTVKGDIDLESMTKFIIESLNLTENDNEPIEIQILYEDVHSLFKSSASGNFSFGCRKGEVRGIAHACKVFMEMMHDNVSVVVRPVYSTTWQKEVVHFADKVMVNGKVDTKATSINAAKRWFPDYRFTKDKGSVIQDGMTDASLIALYGLRTSNKK